MDAKLSLEHDLLFREEKFFGQYKFERLSGFVIVNDWRHVPQLLPVGEHIPQAPTRILAQANPPEGRNNSRITNLFFPWL